MDLAKAGRHLLESPLRSIGTAVFGFEEHPTGYSVLITRVHSAFSPAIRKGLRAGFQMNKLFFPPCPRRGIRKRTSNAPASSLCDQ